MKKLLILSAIVIVIALVAMYQTTTSVSRPPRAHQVKGLWDFRAIDTMKYSRDLALEKIDDPSFNSTIDDQMVKIKNTGATHVGIATPYDEKFLPMLKRWVSSARNHKLKVWFRGNFSGWEGWFEYSRIDRATHLTLVESFIINNPELFEDGDVFSPCPECENGGPGDPRSNGDVQGHRDFLIAETEISDKAFKRIQKSVQPNYASMNGDVAKLIMDPETTKKMGGIVVIDHYVKDPKQLAKDAILLAEQSGGNIILGEFGAPIPDINGEMTETEQKVWLEQTLQEIANTPEIVGVSYWTNFGGSTKIWNDDGSPREAVGVLRKFYLMKRQVFD